MPSGRPVPDAAGPSFLRTGGRDGLGSLFSAVDAAVAAALCLGVVCHISSGMGGCRGGESAPATRARAGTGLGAHVPLSARMLCHAARAPARGLRRA